MWWLTGSIVLVILSLSCIISTSYDLAKGKFKINTGEFWGPVVFHAVTMIAAFWLLLKFLGI